MSLNTQDYSDIEHIIVDGASTDATLDSVRRHGDRVNAVISEKDNGIYEAFNKGINVAIGDVIGFLHSDDLYANQNVLSRIALEFTNKAEFIGLAV
jgi:glycosyltransferase